MAEDVREEILKELRRITKLLLLSVTNGQSQKQRIAVLSELGFEPREIADVLGTTRNTVNVALSVIRKKKGKKDGIE